MVARRTNETSYMTGVTLDDIAGVVALLCADQGGYDSGATLDVNSGLYFGP